MYNHWKVVYNINSQCIKHFIIKDHNKQLYLSQPATPISCPCHMTNGLVHYPAYICTCWGKEHPFYRTLGLHRDMTVFWEIGNIQIYRE